MSRDTPGRRAGKSKSPAAYTDVKFVLDMAVNKPGLQYHLKTVGAAINFKLRCNKFRNLMREMLAEQYSGLPGFRAETVYDPIVIRQVGPDLKSARDGTILLFDHQQLSGNLFDPETGKEIEIPDVSNIIKEN